MDLDEYLEMLDRYCKLHNSDKKEDYELFRKEFEDVEFTDLLDKCPYNSDWTEAGSFNSPGYDMWSYALAWVDSDRDVSVRTYVLESF